MLNRLHSLILAMSSGMLLASSVAALAQKSPPEPKTVADSINYIWHDVEHDFTAVAEAMPPKTNGVLSQHRANSRMSGHLASR